MPTLDERLKEVMAAMNWHHADVVRVSGQSSSVVSQWMNKGSKRIHTIRKMSAAIALGNASGYSPLWIAEGIEPKKQAPHPKKPVAAPPLPGRDFADRREVSETDWALLQAVKIVVPEAEKDRIRSEADRILREALEQLEAAKRDP